jgi:hypothetical protein
MFIARSGLVWVNFPLKELTLEMILYLVAAEETNGFDNYRL